MKKSILFSLVAALGLLAASFLSAATINVPGDYTTIQAAIDAAAPGDVISVAAGTYSEKLSITTGLTIQGEGIGSSMIDATGLPAGGAVVAISLTSGNVLFDGFTIITGDGHNGFSPGSTSSGSTITISHNRIVGTAPSTADNFGLIAGYGSLASLVFTYNTITGCDGNSILLERHVGPTDVSYNTFDRNPLDTSSDAYFNMNYGGSDITSLQRVSHNTIDMGAGSTFTNDTRGVGISFTSSYTGVVGGFTHIEITDNVIANLKPYRRGISLWNNAPSGTVSGAVGDIAAPLIARNTITNAPGYTGQFGIRILGLATDAIVTNNSASGVDDGFWGVAYNGNLPVSAVVNGNSFVDCLSGCDWAGAGTLDASANWWGSNVPADVAATIGGDVDYTPWLDDGADASGDPGFQGDFSALWVDDSSPQTGAAGRIEEGIGLVTGSTVYLAPGTYEEQVEIAKPLTLDGGGGGGGGAIIKSPVTLTKSFTTGAVNKPVVYIHDCDGVTVERLTVDGAGRGNSNYRFQGIAFWNAGGTVDHCVIKDVEDTPFSGSQHGIGIYSYSTGTASHAVNVRDCELYGFQKNAMALNAGDTNPFTVDVRRNIVTGAGATSVTAQNGIQVWAAMGTGTVADNTVSGIGYAGTGVVATSLLQYFGDVDFIGNTVTDGQVGIYNNFGSGDITGNAITVSLIGSYADGIVAADPWNKTASPFGEAPAAPGARIAMGGTPLEIDITGNTVAFNGATNTGAYGIEAYAGYSPEDVDVAINGNVVSGFEYGIVMSRCASGCDTGVFTSLVAQYNSIAGNTGYGMYSDVDYLTADGRYNWWGDASGPHHPTQNPSGAGNEVSDNVLFDPHFGAQNEVVVVPPSTLTNCATPRTVTFHLDQVGIPTDEVRGYEIKFSVDPALVTAGTFVEGDFLRSVGATQFYALSNGGGAYTVSCVILGGTAGGKDGGDLFTVTLTPVAQGTSGIAFTSIKIRDLSNAPLAGAGLAGSIRIDCTAPTMDAIAEAEGGWYNASPVLSHVGFDDDLNLDRAEYNYDGGSWTEIFSGIDATEWNSDPWALPGFAGLSQGSHTINFRVKDDADNWSAATYSWQFYKDTEPPAPPTNLAAAPGHNTVHLTWTNPGGDPTFVGVEIRRVAWGDYPQYGTPGPPAPSYPADHTQGTFVALEPGAAHDDASMTGRDIYYYAAFSKDLAGNYSTLGSTAKGRATSYWLGDIDSFFDGVVGTNDLVVFSPAFGSVQGSGGWNAICDFGPTDDWSRLGIPLPDDKVDFEDLMIFAMNWGNVTPVGLGEYVASRVDEDLRNLVSFEIVAVDDHTISLLLANRAEALKGVRLTVEVSNAELVRVDRGALFAGKSELFFGTLPAPTGTADVCAAALGVGVPLRASGELARLTVNRSGEAPAVVTIKSADLRDVENESTEINVTGGYETPFVPKATALMQNFPNPFNPTTTLTFDVAQAGNVTIAIYDVSGRLVATLLDARVDVGRRHVEWNGTDASGSLVPSGIYFYRMKAAGFEATRKMILVR
jgi:hypothetical protein